MPQLKPDQTLDGRYRLIRVIGGGTFGTVWCAEHLALCSPVAIKVMDRARVTTPELRDRFIREAWAAAALRSPHVVQILDCGVADGTTYIVMELLEGEALEDRLARCRRLDVIQTERLLRHVGRAIDRAHSTGIIHRDLKPGNIFIQSNDGDEIIKVLDFGIAKSNSEAFSQKLTGNTPPGVVLGTPHYMSPEQVQGVTELDARTDIWSLGMIAFECLLGRAAFEGSDIARVLRAILVDQLPVPSALGDVPAGFDEWFARACAREPGQRFESGKLAASEFTRLCRLAEPASESPQSLHQVEPTSEPEPPVVRAVRSKTLPWPTRADSFPELPTKREPQRRRLRLSVALAALLVTLGSLAALFSDGSSAEPTKPFEAPPLLEARNEPLRAPPSAAAAPSEAYAAAAPASEQASAPTDPIASAAATTAVEAEAAPLPVASAAPRRRSKSPAQRARRSMLHRREPSPAPAAARQAAAREAAAPQAPASQAPASPVTASCDPPWSVDDQGRVKAKRECL